MSAAQALLGDLWYYLIAVLITYSFLTMMTGSLIKCYKVFVLSRRIRIMEEAIEDFHSRCDYAFDRIYDAEEQLEKLEPQD